MYNILVIPLKMLFLLATEAPNCFSRASFLQGDIQSRILMLNLLPQEPMDPLCLALNGSFGTAQLFYLDPVGFPDFISAQFQYITGKTNVAQISISTLTTAQVTTLIKIQGAFYSVKIQKSAEILGALETIQYLKIDVSSCWSNIVFAYGPHEGDQQILMRLTPNQCTIPVDAVMYPVFTFKVNESQIQMAEFQEHPEPEEYKHPYNHTQVTMARMKCIDVPEDDLKQQCYDIINFVTNSQEFLFGVKLVYKTNGLSTNVIQQSSSYQTIGSRVCSEEIDLTTYFFPDGFFLQHGQFQIVPDCIISTDSVRSTLTGIIMWGDSSFSYTSHYTIEQYKKTQNHLVLKDMTELLKEQFSSQPQYIQYNDQDQISGSFYQSTRIVKQCFYLVNLLIIDDFTVDLEFRSHYFDVCQNISEDFDFSLFSIDLEVLLKERFNIKIDVTQPITKHRFRLKTNIAALLQNYPEAEFSVRGQNFYFSGKDINYAKDILFIIIQLSYFLIYLSISLITVFVVLKKQNAKE